MIVAILITLITTALIVFLIFEWIDKKLKEENKKH